MLKRPLHRGKMRILCDIDKALFTRLSRMQASFNHRADARIAVKSAPFLGRSEPPAPWGCGRREAG